MPSPAMSVDMQIAAGTSASGGNGLLSEHLAAASRKGIASSELTTTASDAFMAAGAAISPASDYAAIAAEARETFQEAMPRQSAAFVTPWSQSEAKTAKKERPSFSVQNLYLQADDMKNMYDLYCQLEMVFGNQEAAA
jgi:hypothetical protein